METRRLKRDLQALLGDYVGQRLREKNFDPKGRKESTLLDELAHYDLAISVALWWLEQEGQDVNESGIIGASSLGCSQYPNHMEREAMILSTFAGMVLNSLPVKEVISLYNCKPSASYMHEDTKSAIVHPFTLSYHPFAMLKSYKAVAHSRRHSQKLQRWRSGQCKAGAPSGQNISVPSSSSSSPQPSLSVSEDSLRDESEHYEGSAESLHD